MSGSAARMSMKHLSMVALLLLALPPASGLASAARGRGGGGRAVGGIIYFTNNTPPDDAILVELLTGDRKKVVAATKPRDKNFRFDGLKAGRYVLRLSWRACKLNYKVDARPRGVTSVQVVMDAACANEKYGPDEVRPQPPPAPG